LYQGFYNLKENPFRLSPDPAYLCMTAQHREALAGLVYSLCSDVGLAVLVGEAGTGKTTLLFSVLNLLERRRFVTAMINNPTMSRAEFYDFMLAKLQVECPSSLKSRQLIALEEALRRNLAAGTPAILIVDEAQRLPTELLEEIRLLLNLETPREKLLRMVVSGQQELIEILRRPEMRQLKQRISCLCKLEALSLEELREYINHRLLLAGMTVQTLFSEENIALIHEFSGGIPRLVNSLCDGALRTGFGMQSRFITGDIIREAAKDLDLYLEVEPEGGRSLAEAPRTDKKEVVRIPVAAASASALLNGSNGVHGKSSNGAQAPLESYAARQKSLGFLTSVMDRWK
jgi:type II secretory pathway predicted ATPase ExeA